MYGTNRECLQIDSWIHIIHIFLIQLFPKKLNGFTKTLEMHDFPFPQEFDHIVYIRIIGKSKDVVVGYPGFLLWERIA